MLHSITLFRWPHGMEDDFVTLLNGYYDPETSGAERKEVEKQVSCATCAWP